jgi:ATP-binding cassette subfamily B protein
MSAPRRRPWRVPLALQGSALDCGPAALHALLAGYGIAVDRQSLRAGCDVGLDGTSTNALEAAARRHGLDARQLLLPPDHLLLPAARALPAILVLRQDDLAAHFVVVWRQCLGRVQILDPAAGRRWLPAGDLLRQTYLLRTPVSAAAWRRWAAGDDLLQPLTARLAALRLPAAEARRLIDQALADPGWRALAALDAATRHLTALRSRGAPRRGAATARAFRALLDDAAAAGDAGGLASRRIPDPAWMVRPAPRGERDERDGCDERLLMAGAVVVSVRGRLAAAGAGGIAAPCAAAARDPLLHPLRQLASRLLADGKTAITATTATTVEPAATAATAATAAILGAAAIAGAALAAIEPWVLWRCVEGLPGLAPGRPRLTMLAVPLGLATGLMAVELGLAGAARRAGRCLEAALGRLWLSCLGNLDDRFFSTRLTSDLLRSSHALARLREAPALALDALRAAAQVAACSLAIVWLDRQAWPWAAALAAAATLLPLAAVPALRRHDLSWDRRAAAVDGDYLDIRRGLDALRAHGAEATFRRRHESRIVAWAHAAAAHAHAVATGDLAVQSLLALLTLALVLRPPARGGHPGIALLLALAAARLAAAGRQLTTIVALRLPALGNLARRLVDPLLALDAANTNATDARRSVPHRVTDAAPGVELRGVGVRRGGHTVLAGLDLHLEPGCHAALVGASGAGKSTLLALLLGLYPADEGVVRIGCPPHAVAWVAPEVRLWNRSLLDNLLYAVPPAASPAAARRRAGRLATSLADRLAATLANAELDDLVRRLPAGLASGLGEGGSRVSAAEAQRVRLARAFMQDGVRLALLDEPFRAIDPHQRRRLLAACRAHWAHASLLCVTHLPSEVAAFDRVLVLAGGCLVEDGPPSTLATRPGSRYANLLCAERMLAGATPSP